MNNDKLFSFNFRDIIKLNDLLNKDFELMCYEFNTLVNSYQIKQELFSWSLWEYLMKTFTINEKTINIQTDVDIDEKNRTHKTYKYTIKCFINKTNYFYIIFFDEKRGYNDKDYHEFATKEDKSNKIHSLTIFYNPDLITEKYINKHITELIKCSYYPTSKNQFYTIQSSTMGFTLSSSYVKEMDIDIELNYGTKFIETNKQIIKSLRNKKHGLFLFHGISGSGKTSYIRKLISELSEEKTIIYIPTYMMNSMADPELMSFISGFKNTILILEDSENILTKGINNRTQAVSNILNMTDGLLNDSLELQIIATFNTEAQMIDDALTRAGRLQVNYKFGKLNKENSQKLIKKLGLNKKATKSMTLAEIYEGHNSIIIDDLENNNKKIGYKFNN